MAENELLQTSIRLAASAIDLRDAMMGLRKIILKNIRQIVEANRSKLEASEDGNICWMLDKIQRGYFGTDVRTEELPKFLKAIEEALK